MIKRMITKNRNKRRLIHFNLNKNSNMDCSTDKKPSCTEENKSSQNLKEENKNL